MNATSPKRLSILCEGAVDRAAVAALVGAAVLPEWCEATEPPKGTTEGVEGVASGLADRIEAGHRVVAMRDLDEGNAELALDALVKRAPTLRANLVFGAFRAGSAGGTFHGVATGTNRQVDVIVVLVGASGDPDLAELGITNWALDDYLLRLVLASDAYASFAVSEKHAEQDPMKVRSKAFELRDLFQRNGIPLRSSKRYLHLLRGVIDFGGSPATFAEHLLRRAAGALPTERLNALLSPWLACLHEAVGRFGQP